MIKLFYTILLIIFCTTSICGQPDQRITPIQEKVYNLFDTNEYDFTYKNSQYRIYVAQAKQGETRNRKLPVLYMLDGNGQYPMLLNQIEETFANFPLIVGIGYPEHKAYPKNRTKDYTIPIEGSDEGGGAEFFYQFISDVLKPFIEEKYNVDTTRQTLCGHSYGGLFVLYTAFNHTSSFQNYIAGSPSIWWGNGKIIPTKRPIFSSLPKSFTITLGECEEKPSLDKPQREMTPDVKAIKERRKGGISARALSEIISEEVPDTRFLLYEGKNHGSSVPLLLNEAIKIAANN